MQFCNNKVQGLVRWRALYRLLTARTIPDEDILRLRYGYVHVLNHTNGTP